MKIKKVLLKNFKRFTDLTIENVPESAKLIILAGPNGCGKSSFFDALYMWHRLTWSGQGGNWDSSYHIKQADEVAISWNLAIQIEFYGEQPANERERKKQFT